MVELKGVTASDIKVNIYLIINNFRHQSSKISGTLKVLKKKSKNEELLKELKALISKWRKILNPEEAAHKHSNEKQKTPPKKKEHEDKKDEEDKKNDFPEDYLIDGASRRNNTRKNLFKNLKIDLEYKNEEEKEKKIEELLNKVVEIEEKLFEKYKADSAYTNRVLEIIHNLKENKQFRDKIINGEINSEGLATMDVKEMVVKEKRDQLDKTIENQVNAARSDWDQKHAKVTSGVYKCRKCGGDKTVQHEMQTRSADEPMTLFITCVTCQNTWRLQIIIIIF